MVMVVMVMMQYWDYTAKGLTLPEVYNSSYALMGATALLTLGLTIYTI
jgi:hypothetical protein